MIGVEAGWGVQGLENPLQRIDSKRQDTYVHLFLVQAALGTQKRNRESGFCGLGSSKFQLKWKGVWDCSVSSSEIGSL